MTLLNHLRPGTTRTGQPAPSGAGRARSVALALAVAAAYWVTGRLGLELAVPPGYATAIWPPSGIALATVMMFGRPALPGVTLGSFLLNLTISPAPVAFTVGSLLPPLLIALGATAQAAAGAWLTRRFRCYPSRLEHGREIVGLLAMGGPVACLINASWSVGWLNLFGVMPSAGLWLNWLTWWAGDVIGVLVFAPLVLTWTNRGPGGRRRAFLSTFGLATGFLIVILVMVWTSATNERRITERFGEVGPVMVSALERALGEQMSAVTAIEGLLTSEAGRKPRTFDDFADRLRTIVPAVQSLEWVPLVAAEDRAAYERETGLGITELIPGGGGIRGAGGRGTYAPITLVNPRDGNERALGLDLLSESVRRTVLLAAELSGTVAVSSSVELVQGGRGILVVAPVKVSGGRVVGFAIAVVRLEALVERAFAAADVPDVAYWLLDRSDGDRPLATNAGGAAADYVLAERGLFGRSVRLGFAQRLSVGGRVWLLRAAPTAAFIDRHDTGNRLPLLIAGMLLTGMTGGVIMLVVGREAILANQVAERTESLTAQGVVLKRQLENMRALNAIATSRTGSLDGSLSDALHHAARHLGLEVGLLTRFDGNSQRVEELEAPDALALGRDDPLDLGGRPDGGAPDSDPELVEVAARDGFAVSKGRERRGFDALGLESYIGASIMVNGAAHGMIWFAGRAPYPRAFDDGDREFMRLLAGWIGAEIGRRELARDLARTARRLEAILASAPVGVLITGLDRRIRMVNPGMAELLGRSEAELIGVHARILYADDETSAATSAMYPALLRGETPDFEAPVVRADGGRIWVRVIGRILSLDDPEEGAIWIVSDITGRKATEEALRERTGALERSNAELEAFAYVASHDLRQPLRSVTNYLTLLERELAGDLREEPGEFLRIAREGAKRMDLLIVDLLEYARVGRSEGAFASHAAPHAMGLVIDRAVASLEAAIDESGAVVTVATPMPKVTCIAGEMLRLFMNLIGNAIKYRAPGRPPEVRVACADVGEFWRFTVADNGIGIAEEHRERVFGIFQRLHGRDRYEGTGIGLAICRKIVEHHRGTIRVEAGPEEGSVFVVDLPKVASPE